MATIFLSYRREDSAAHAGRLYDRLSAHFGKANVFMDIDTIDLGEDFVDAITKTVGVCDVLIALIGRQWLTATDAEGRCRLEKPDDFVRMEIAAALERNIRVVPALVGGASMPIAEGLPQPLAKLATRNGLQISDERFHQDVDRLVESIERALGSSLHIHPLTPTVRTAPRPIYRHPTAIAIFGVLALVIAWQTYTRQPIHVPTPMSGLVEPRDGTEIGRGEPLAGSGFLGSQESSPAMDVETIKIKRTIDANAQYYSGLSASDPAMQRTKPNLGVLMVPVSQQFANAFALSRPAGAMISEVARGSSAAEAGLRRGDLILLFGRATIQDVDDFEDKIRAAAPGTTVKLTVWRLNEKGVDTFTTEIVTPASNSAELQFHRLRKKIDESNTEAKSIIDSIGR